MVDKDTNNENDDDDDGESYDKVNLYFQLCLLFSFEKVQRV